MATKLNTGDKIKLPETISISISHFDCKKKSKKMPKKKRKRKSVINKESKDDFFLNENPDFVSNR